MSIDKMTQQEKSCHLVTLCEFEPAIIKGHGACWIDSNYTPVFDVPSGFPLAIEAPNLYDPENMALAWRVLNWADDPQNGINVDSLKIDDCFALTDWFVNNIYSDTPREVAQTAWLDKILELAIKAGMIE